MTNDEGLASDDGMKSTHGHFERLAHLLELEAAAEAEQLARRAARGGGAAERSGNCLVKLAIRDQQPAFGGRVVVTLGKRDQMQSLPWNRLGAGTPVLVTEENVAPAVASGRAASRGWRGLVSRRDQSTLDIVLTQAPESENERPTYRVDLADDEIARQRMKSALSQARAADRGQLAQLRDVLLGVRQPSPGFAARNHNLPKGEGFSVPDSTVGLVFDPDHVHVYADSLLVEGAA